MDVTAGEVDNTQEMEFDLKGKTLENVFDETSGRGVASIIEWNHPGNPTTRRQPLPLTRSLPILKCWARA
jgi:hypothetical protein